MSTTVTSSADFAAEITPFGLFIIIYTYLLFEINSPSTEIAQPSGHFKLPEVITLPSSATRPERKSVFDCERVIFSSRDKILSIRSIICIFVGRG